MSGWVCFSLSIWIISMTTTGIGSVRPPSSSSSSAPKESLLVVWWPHYWIFFCFLQHKKCPKLAASCVIFSLPSSLITGNFLLLWTAWTSDLSSFVTAALHSLESSTNIHVTRFSCLDSWGKNLNSLLSSSLSALDVEIIHFYDCRRSPLTWGKCWTISCEICLC